MLIGGAWTDSSRRIEVFNPARPDELVAPFRMVPRMMSSARSRPQKRHSLLGLRKATASGLRSSLRCSNG
jgi:hypothetical protein